MRDLEKLSILEFLWSKHVKVWKMGKPNYRRIRDQSFRLMENMQVNFHGLFGLELLKYLGGRLHARATRENDQLFNN